MTYLPHRRFCFVRSHGSAGRVRGRVFRHDHKAPSPHYPASPPYITLSATPSFTATPPSLPQHLTATPPPPPYRLPYHTTSFTSPPQSYLISLTLPYLITPITTTLHHPHHYCTSSSLPLLHLIIASSVTSHRPFLCHTSASLPLSHLIILSYITSSLFLPRHRLCRLFLLLRLHLV